MSYDIKVIELEKDLEDLRVEYPIVAKYTDLGRLEKDLNDFGLRIGSMDLRQSDKYSFLKRIEDYKDNINRYKHAQTTSKENTGNFGKLLLGALIGTAYILGLKTRDIMNLYRRRKPEEIGHNADLITNRIIQRLYENPTESGSVLTNDHEKVN